MPGAETSIGAVSYTFGAVAFLILLVPLAAGRPRRLPDVLLVAACAATLAWAAAAAAAYYGIGGSARFAAALEVVRSIAWIAVLVSLFRPGGGAIGRPRYLVPALVVAVVVVTAASVLAPDSADPDQLP